jgi:hypothetical protein
MPGGATGVTLVGSRLEVSVRSFEEIAVAPDGDVPTT